MDKIDTDNECANCKFMRKENDWQMLCWHPNIINSIPSHPDAFGDTLYRPIRDLLCAHTHNYGDCRGQWFVPIVEATVIPVAERS